MRIGFRPYDPRPERPVSLTMISLRKDAPVRRLQDSIFVKLHSCL